MNLEAIRVVQQEKLAFTLPWDEMQELRCFLGEHFGISRPPDGRDIFAEIRSSCGDRIADEYEAINETRAFGTPQEFDRADRKFYELISQDPLLGMVHSEKWSYIFDAAVYLTSLARAIDCPGPFLDLGCHAGYHALWLGHVLSIKGRGIDRSKQAVRYARAKGKKIGLTPSIVSFDAQTAIDSAPEGGYPLIYSIDGPVEISGSRMTIADVLPFLASDGIIVWIGPTGGTEEEYLKSAIGNAGLSLVLTDVIGGWDGRKFEANTVLVLARGDDPRVNDGTLNEREWVWNNGFSAYCNVEGRASSEKILSIYRSHEKYGPIPQGFKERM